MAGPAGALCSFSLACSVKLMSRCDIKKMPCSQQTECCRCRPLGEKKCCAPLNGKGERARLQRNCFRLQLERRDSLWWKQGKRLQEKEELFNLYFCVPLLLFLAFFARSQAGLPLAAIAAFSDGIQY